MIQATLLIPTTQLQFRLITANLKVAMKNIISDRKYIYQQTIVILLTILLTYGGVLIAILPELKDGERLQSFILWLTAIIVVWYTKETHLLRRISQSTFNEIQNQSRLEITPLVELRLSQNNGGFFGLINHGKGVALNVELTFHLGDVLYSTSRIPAISAEGEYHFVLEEKGGIFDNVLNKQDDSSGDIYWVLCEFEDVNGTIYRYRFDPNGPKYEGIFLITGQ